jgi:dCTP deaminase
MHTLERVWTRRFVAVLDGKSSLGRLGVSIHQTAGYGDPGFDGHYTLEMTTIYPVRLRVGMRVAQMRFHEPVGETLTYAGRYTGLNAVGPVAARPLE